MWGGKESGAPQGNGAPTPTGEEGCYSPTGGYNVSQEKLENIAAEVRGANRWVNFKFVPNPNRSKLDKIPCGLHGYPHDATNSANHMAFDEAVAKWLATSVIDGVGFALGPDGKGGNWQGIDLDDIEARGLQWLADILPGYVEWSPSGKGVHAIGYGEPFPAFKHGGIEAYSEGRFLTFTGNVIRYSL